MLLVDDSIVRGTTSAQIIELAREAGARKVYFASAAPPVRHPYVYGIDMPAASELVAAGRDVDEVARQIGADWLIYQDLEDLVDRLPARQRGHQRIRHLVLLRQVRHRRRHAGIPASGWSASVRTAPRRSVVTARSRSP